jgi:ribonuclease E
VLWTNYEAATEIARQLKLRNIGGVVIIDFIDMESRRDQLQLLEHFTAEVRHDSARPQIAQISELGLVELTRKRQGQNIYELFGRACPSCGGLGHVAVLPGKDSLQPLATAGGLVRSAASARAEVLSPSAGEAAGGRRRRGGRGRGAGSGGGDLDLFGAGAEDSQEPVAGQSLDAATAAAGEAASRRPEPELVAVPMDSDQELVYGWLGLNPALLLEESLPAENVMVRVIRPGDDAEAVLAEARQQLAAAGPRRRRRGRGGSSAAAETPGTESLSDPAPLATAAAAVSLPRAELQPVTVDITPFPDESFHPVAVLPDATIEVVASPRSGRGRGRSRNGSTVSVSVQEPALTPVAVAVVSEPIAPPIAVEAEAEDDNGEPRRRRRRSSASGD